MSHSSEIAELNFHLAQNLRDRARDGAHAELAELIIALQTSGFDVAELLNSRDRDNRTALLLAAIGEHPECERILLTNGADPRVENGAESYLELASDDIIPEFHLEELVAEREALREEMEAMDRKEDEDDSLAASLRRDFAAEEERSKARAAEEYEKERAMKIDIMEEDRKEMDEEESEDEIPAKFAGSPQGSPVKPPRTNSL